MDDIIVLKKPLLLYMDDCIVVAKKNLIWKKKLCFSVASSRSLDKFDATLRSVL